MKLPNDRTVFLALSWTVGGLVVMLGMEACFPLHLEEHYPLFAAFHGFVIAILLLVILVLGFLREQRRTVQASVHSQELLAMQREADHTERRYRSLLECAGVAIFVISFDNGHLEEVNRAGTELLGFDREELALQRAWDLVIDGEQKEFTSFVLQVKRTGQAGPRYITFRRKDGSVFLGEVTARLIELGDGKVVQAIVRDVTLQRQAELEIRLRNRKLSLLNSIIVRASQNPDLPAVLDVTLRETLIGLGAGAGTVHLLDSNGKLGTLAATSNIKESFLATARPGEIPGKGPCPMLVSGACHSHARSIAAVCGMTEFTTDQGFPSVVGIPLFAKKRLIGVMHLMNAAEREYTPDDIKFFTTMGNQIGMVIDHARLFAELNWKTEELLRSHGLLEKSSHQLAHSQHRLRKNLALVEEANAELERLNGMKNSFLGMISHEFKTPLTGILCSAEFLQSNRETISRDEEWQLLETIHHCGSRLNGMVSDLLKVARLEADTTPVRKTPLHLAEILEHVQEQLAPLITQRRQQIGVSDLTPLPYFGGDRESLVDVFTRLLENAIKFTPDEGEIVISARLTDRLALADKRDILCRFYPRFSEQMGGAAFLQVEVRDSGVGISPEEHTLVFDKFYEIGDIRFHSSGKTKFQGKGTGLGLTIAKGMVEAHGGMIWVESHAKNGHRGGGTSFFLLLPLEENTNQQTFSFMHPESTVPHQRSFEEYHETFSKVIAERYAARRVENSWERQKEE